MRVEILDVSLDQFRGISIWDYLHQLRERNCIRLLRLRHTRLLWTSFLLCSPKDHVLGMQDCLMTSTMGKWQVATYKSEKIRQAFALEHEHAGVPVEYIPEGFYVYASADKSEPKSSRIGGAARRLEEFWFGAFYVPRTDEFERLFVERLQRAVDELGWYLIRPFSDENVNNEEDLIQNTKRLDRYLFDITGTESRMSTVYKTLDQMVECCESGQFPNRESLALVVTFYGKCVFPYGSVQAEVISSLRARLIHLVGWPTFYTWSMKGLADIRRRTRRKRGQSGDTPYATVSELSAYLDECRFKYPVLNDDPFEPLWRAGRISVHESAMLV